MPRCGSFTHDLIDPRDRGTWDSVKIVRCTIVSINHRLNTADVELGEVPPATVPFGELTDIDCPDIPVFEGDGWSVDEKRRRMNGVPIFYHCQGSTGTVGELKTGHMAFKVPAIELTTPPYSEEDVATTHAINLREKVLMIFIPPTEAEFNSGTKGHRFIVGHTDRNDIAPCLSEYICLRISDAYDTEVNLPPPDDEEGNPNFGHSTPAKTIVSIVDPIGQRIYKGLAPYGITFPCYASAIINKASAIVLDENTLLADIAFLDTLYAINAFFSEAFVFQSPYCSQSGQGSVTFYLDPNCHQYHPVKLCWLTHFFDYGLQCVPYQDDKRLLNEPYHTCFLQHPGVGALPAQYYTPDNQPDMPVDFEVTQYVYARYYLPGPSGTYVGRVAGSTQPLSSAVPHAISASTTEVLPNGDDRHNIVFSDWILAVASWGSWSSDGSFSAASRMTVSGERAYSTHLSLYGYSYDYTYDITVKVYSPWLEDQMVQEPWITFTTKSAPIAQQIFYDAAMIGTGGSYALTAIVYDDNGETKARTLFAYNSDCYYPLTSLHDVSYFKPLFGAGDYLSVVFQQMYNMFILVDQFTRPKVTAFVIHVLEP